MSFIVCFVMLVMLRYSTKVEKSSVLLFRYGEISERHKTFITFVPFTIDFIAVDLSQSMLRDVVGIVYSG